MPRQVLPFLFVLLLVLITAPVTIAESLKIMTSDDLPSFGHPVADARISYGNDPLQFVELRLPEGPGPHPVIILIHGGCWLSKFDIAHAGKLARAFAGNGIASWALEYRRVGNEGGGWPGTFQDIVRGSDTLLEYADKYQLDLSNVIAAGHSAGGQLVQWLAARKQYSNKEHFRSSAQVNIKGILALAPASDIEKLHEMGTCNNVINKLMGGSPAEYGERYRMASPLAHLPLGLPQTIIIGSYDDAWKEGGRNYYRLALKAGDDVQLIEARESGHFEMIDPDSSTWPIVLGAARQLLGK